MSEATNPFPGMNPYLEELWPGAHTSLLVYMRDQLQSRLPADLRARIEHHLAVHDAETGKRGSREADMAITESWKVQEDEPGGVAVADSVLVALDGPEQRYLQIQNLSGRVITVIELFSPTNKLQGEKRADFRLKRRECLTSGIAFVQIDLLLQGEPVLEDEARDILRDRRAPYHVATHARLSEGTWRIYPIALRERLPAVEIPLREEEKPVVLELQPLIDGAIRSGAYDDFDYRRDPPGTLSEEDRAWLDAHLRKQGLR